AGDLEGLVARLETVVKKLEGKAGGGGSGDSAETAKFVEAFDEFVSQCVDPYLAASAVLGDMADMQAKLFKEICTEQRNFLLVVSKYGKPAVSSSSVLNCHIVKKMGEMNDLRSKLSRKSDQKSHMMAACEGVSVFGWIGYPKSPKTFVKETKESAKFYTNKVLTETKSGNKSTEHKNWVNAYLEVFDGFYNYIHEHHTTGPSWNASISDSYSAIPFPPSPLPTQLTPPPPPPLPTQLTPPPPAALPTQRFVPPDELIRNKIFNKILNSSFFNIETNLTKFKLFNKSLVFNDGIVKMSSSKLQEFQENAPDLKIKDTEMKQTVYMYKCVNSVLTIDEKINSIVLDSCKKVGLVFTSVVSGVELINCQSMTVQCQGQMPTVSIDKTDGCLIYLSNECLDCEIISAKSSEMNVSIPKEDGDFVEYPIVEQFRTNWNPAQKTFVTTATESI
uniref:C-CAP/cofactor C-like domain-containing protein n=1 Tax=Ciona savignyi TaxID=51511 RepID=H2YWX0_CIOSA